MNKRLAAVLDIEKIIYQRQGDSPACFYFFKDEKFLEQTESFTPNPMDMLDFILAHSEDIQAATHLVFSTPGYMVASEYFGSDYRNGDIELNPNKKEVLSI